MINGKKSISFTYKLILGLLVFFTMIVVSLIVGAADISISDVWLSITSDSAKENITIIREIRLPRVIAAVLVGAALSVAGAIMQGITRNPLADPGLLGLSAGAYAALAITIAFIPSANYLIITFSCFIGAAVGTFMVFGLGSLNRGGFSPLKIVLAGAAISSMLYAIGEAVGIYFKVSKNVSMWTAGGMIGASWSQLQVVIPFIIFGIILSILLAKQLTILSLNEEVAVGLGQKTTQVKVILFIVIILLAGASVALIGNMAFIGLMVPHIVRAIVGTDYRYIIPMAAITGSTFMVFADTLSRTINAPYETPVIAIISVIGLPFFLAIVRKGGQAFS